MTQSEFLQLSLWEVVTRFPIVFLFMTLGVFLSTWHCCHIALFIFRSVLAERQKRSQK